MHTRSRVVRLSVVLVAAIAGIHAAGTRARAAAAGSDPVRSQLMSRDQAEVEAGVAAIRAMLVSDPRRAVDRLNEEWMVALLRTRQYEAVKEFAIAGTLAAPADTWRIEQLYRHYVRALLDTGRPQEALSAAKALFNVSSLSFLPTSLDLLSECLRAAHPEDPGIVPRFKLQQLAGAQTDEAERRKALAEAGESVLSKIEVDPKPYAAAIARRRGMADYRGLYGTGNLLLLSGQIKEAREVFDKAVAMAPENESKYANEAAAKLLKAEDGSVGRANAWVMSIRPAQ